MAIYISQKPRNLYSDLKAGIFQKTGYFDIYSGDCDCCSFVSIFPYVLKYHKPRLTSLIYGDYPRTKDYYKQVRPIRLKDNEDDKWNNR